jgi:hypothetical protein
MDPNPYEAPQCRVEEEALPAADVDWEQASRLDRAVLAVVVLVLLGLFAFGLAVFFSLIPPLVNRPG